MWMFASHDRWDFAIMNAVIGVPRKYTEYSAACLPLFSSLFHRAAVNKKIFGRFLSHLFSLLSQFTMEGFLCRFLSE